MAKPGQVAGDYIWADKVAAETSALEFLLTRLIDAGDSVDPKFRTSVYEKQLQRMNELAASLRQSGNARVRHDRLRDSIAAVEVKYPGNANEPAMPAAAQDPDITPEPQTSAALVFRADDDGLVSLAPEAGQNLMSKLGEARDLHGELRAFALELEAPLSDGGIGSNSSLKVHRAATRLVQALGDQPASVSPGLLIPRGELLRQLHVQQERIEEGDISDVAPLPESVRSQLALVVRTFNGYVANDPELRRRDIAQLGPDALVDLVSPSTGQALAESALAAGVISPDALDSLSEEGSAAPAAPSPTDRRSRRYSESAKNLVRTLLALAYQKARFIAGAAIATTTTSYAVFGWVLSNEQWVRAIFAHSPRMLDLLNWLIPYLKMLPLQ